MQTSLVAVCTRSGLRTNYSLGDVFGIVVRGSASVFRRRWFEPDECWYNEELAAAFSAVLAVRSAFNAVISCDKPGDHDAAIVCSSPLYELLQVTT